MTLPKEIIISPYVILRELPKPEQIIKFKTKLRKPRAKETKPRKPYKNKRPIPVLRADDGSNAVVAWIDYCQQHYSKNSINSYKSIVYQFLRILPEEITTIEQLNISFLESYISTIADEYSKIALYHQRAAITSFYRWMSIQYDMPDVTKKVKLKPKPKKIPVLKANDGSNVFIMWIDYSRRQLSKSNQSFYRTVVSRFIESLPEGIERIDQLSNEFIESYIKSFESKCTKLTLRHYRYCLRAFHRWVSQQYGIPDIIPKKPLKPKKPPKPKKLPKPKKPLPILKAGETNVVVEWIEHSPRQYRSVITNFVESLPEGIETIHQLRNEFIESYIESVTSRYKKNTLNTHRVYLRTFHHWLSRQYGIKDVILRKPRKLTEPRTIKPKPEPKPIPILKEPDGSNVIADWLEYCQRHVKGTQYSYRAAITNFIEYSSIENIDQLSCKKIEQYISRLLGDGKANSTANTRLAAIKSFCRWLSRNYDVPNCTTGIQELREEPPERRVLTWDEYQKILSVCNGQDADIVRFLCHTGVRASEFIKMKWADVSPDLKMLTIIGKGRKKRYVVLNKVCREILSKYERGPDDTLLHFVRRCTNRKTLYLTCARLAKRADIPVAGPHSYRHLFATELLRRGVPISHVSKLLGHSSIAITEKAYIHFQPDFLNGITDVLAE